MRKSVSLQAVMLCVLVLVWSVFGAVVKESFDYPEGDLAGQGDASGGWGGAWETPERGLLQVVNEPLGFGNIPVSGGMLEVAEGGTTYRDLEQVWPDDGSAYWVSMLYIRIDDIDVNESYNGFSLFKGTQELLYIGKPWATRNLGLDGSGVESDTTSGIDAYDGAWLVVKLIMTGDEEDDYAYLWIDPDPNVEPDTTDANARVQWNGSNGFDRVRIGSGNPPNQAECFYDEIRITNSFAELTAAGDDGPLPAPVSFYDFEGEDLTVIDQGTAANNGEIVGDWVERSEGGIITKEGDGTGCLEWIEENAFGELSYVYLPYREFMNSSDYTLSAWIMYNGEPNWATFFGLTAISGRPRSRTVTSMCG